MNNPDDRIIVVDESTLKDKIYTIRGQQVMLDFDLAEIYGYETKNLNRQVKNNIERFEGDDFMFHLTKEEFDNLRCKKYTSSWGGSRYLPYAFTEQGIYLLMTILKGELAIKQSRTLVRLFKTMKDYLIENQPLLTQKNYFALVDKIEENSKDIKEIRETKLINIICINIGTSNLFRNTNRLYIITINDTPEKCFVCCVLTELLQNNITNVIILKTCYRGKIMIKHQRKIFGIKFDVERINPVGLPLYLTAGRSFWRYTYSGMSFIIVNIPNDEKFGVIAFEKQRALLEKRFESPVAFSFSYISGRQRDSLIEKNIPFISDAKQLYLPFWGMMLSDRLAQQKQINAEKMMPVTQALFLHILYNSNNKPMLKKDAAEFLSVTRTSITRASDQLLAMELINQEMIGKECYMMPVMTGKELYEKAKRFLINPVQNVITTDNDFDSYPFSGESALSMCSMLNAPKIPVRAIYKSDVDINEISEIDVRWSSDDGVVNLELWKYDPRLFEKKGVVDPVSLAMSLTENVDERIEASIEEYLEEYEW